MMPKLDSGAYITNGGAIANGVDEKSRHNGYREGELWEYLTETDVYQCPGDRSQFKNPIPYNYTRTYSISGMMRGEDARINTSTGVFDHNDRKAYMKDAQIKMPSEKLVFMEEDPYTRHKVANTGGEQWANKGSWVLTVSSSFSGPARLWDGVAFWHGDRNSISFADGHAEIHTWEDKRTMDFTRGIVNAQNASDNNPDVRWLNRAYGGLLK